MSKKYLLLSQLLVLLFLIINPSVISSNEAETMAEKMYNIESEIAAPPEKPAAAVKPMDYIFCHPWWDHDCHHKHRPAKSPTAPPKMEAPTHERRHRKIRVSPLKPAEISY